MTRRITLTAMLLFTLLLTAGVNTDVKAEGKPEAVRVMILPFDGSAAGNFGYLTDAIRAMVSSRLAATEGIELVEYAVKAEEIRQLSSGDTDRGESLFGRYHIDYVVSGALYALHTGLKVQVAVTGKDDGQEPAQLNVLAENEENIIPQVEVLVADIAGRAMGFEVTGGTVAAPGEKATGLSGFTTEHPEKVYKKGLYKGAVISENAQNMTITSQGVKRSSKLPLMIVAMAVGDLDSDGNLDIIAASRTSLLVSRFNDSHFIELTEYEFPKTFKLNGVNVADLNGDGQPEIYVSGNDGIRVSSSIFALAEGQLKPLATGIGWYLRTVEWPGKGVILAGQRGTNRADEGFLARKVSQLRVLDNFSGVEEERVLPLPTNVNLFDFAWVELDGKGGPELVAVDQREKILVFDSENNLQWVSDQDYGGSRNHYGLPWSEVEGASMKWNDGGDGNRINTYIPTRLLAADVDGDGTMEIVVGRNARLYGKWLKNSREYDGGTISCLGWRDGGLSELWRTNKLNGYVADYSLVMKQYDPEAEEGSQGVGLYVAQVPDKKMFGFSFSSDSKLLRYDIEVKRGSADSSL